MTTRLLFTVAAALGLLVSTAGADEYWITYEGNDYPENEGWIYIWSLPRAIRGFEDGAFVIDSRASGRTNDYYQMSPNSVSPDPGELFIAQWRLKVDELSIGWRDPSVGVFGDDSWAVGLTYGEDTIFSVYEVGVSVHFEPYVYHNYELRSADMRTYQLYIDGALALEGDFWNSLSSSRIGWGDTVSGGASLTHWDYLRFGVVPEPASIVTIVVLLGACHNVRRGATHTRVYLP